MSYSKLRKLFSSQPPTALARLFSTRTLRFLAKDSIPTDFADTYFALSIESAIGRSTRLSDIYQAAFDTLLESTRSEYVFKNAIAERLLYGRHSPRTAALLFEFRAAGNKLDALLLNGTSNAFEVKTSLDELRRLPAQVTSYQKLFKNIWLLTDVRHVDAALEMLPSQVGIKVLSRRSRLENVRPAATCLDHLEPDAIIASLRKNEYLSIASASGNPIDGIPNTRQFETARAIFCSLDRAWLHDAMVAQLKQRFALVNQHLAIRVPKPLAAAAISMNLSSLDAERFLANLSRKATDILGAA